MSTGIETLMRYFANPCGRAVIEAMRDGHIGMIDQPMQKKVAAIEEAHAVNVAWCADNGAFADTFDEVKWWEFLQANVHRANTCLFAVAPDVVGDADATIARSRPWMQKIRALGYPVAFVAQDGLTVLRGALLTEGFKSSVAWQEFDVLFIGGTTTWKLGPHVRQIVAEAKAQGKWVHMGRVNSERRYEYARAIGCDSADGTYLTFGPDVNLPKLLAWTRNTAQDGLFVGEGATELWPEIEAELGRRA